MIRFRSILTGAAPAAGLFLTACTSMPEGATGYLKSYDTMNPHPEDPTGMRYVAPGNRLLDFDQLLFDAFEIKPLPGSALAAEDPVAMNRLAGQFRGKLIEVVGPYYSVVSSPSGGVLRLRCALTEIGFRGDGRTAADVQSVRFEAEMQNSITGERVAAVMRTFDAGDYPAFDVLAVGLLDFMNEQHSAE